MYWWNTRHLARNLKENLLSEYDKMKYFLATSLLVTLGIYLSYFDARNSYTAILTEALLMILIIIFGIRRTFKTNNGNEGSEYIVRMTCLSFPILIKLFVLGFILGLVLGIASVGVEIVKNDWITLIFSVSFEALYFWRLNIHLKHINA